MQSLLHSNFAQYATVLVTCACSQILFKQYILCECHTSYNNGRNNTVNLCRRLHPPLCTFFHVEMSPGRGKCSHTELPSSTRQRQQAERGLQGKSFVWAGRDKQSETACAATQTFRFFTIRHAILFHVLLPFLIAIRPHDARGIWKFSCINKKCFERGRSDNPIRCLQQTFCLLSWDSK